MLMSFSPCTRWCLISALCFLAGCVNSKVRYKDLLMPLSRMGVSANRLEAFPAFLLYPDSKAVPSGGRLILETSPEPTVFESDHAGQVMIPVTSALLRNNPPARFEPKGVNLVLRFSAKLDGNKVKSVQIFSPSGMKVKGDSRVAVFHEGGQENLASEVRSELLRARGVIKTMLGLEPLRWAVILETRRKEMNVLYLTVPAAGYDSSWRCFKEEWESGDFMSVNPHKWTESVLISAIALYDDPQNRFIGDGLAELVTWRISGLPKDYLQRLSPAQIGDQKTVDLLSAFRTIPDEILHLRKIGHGMEKHGFPPGYALSFAFWHELYEKHGSTLITRFVEKMRRHPSASAEDAIAILVELTGDKKLGDRIRFANVAAARSRIQRLLP